MERTKIGFIYSKILSQPRYGSRPRPDLGRAVCDACCEEGRAYRGSGTCGVGQRCLGEPRVSGRRTLWRGERRSLGVKGRGQVGGKTCKTRVERKAVIESAAPARNGANRIECERIWTM